MTGENEGIIASTNHAEFDLPGYPANVTISMAVSDSPISPSPGACSVCIVLPVHYNFNAAAATAGFAGFASILIPAFNAFC